MKPTMFVNSIEEEDPTIAVGTIMEHNDPPSLLVMVTDIDGQPGSFTGIQLDNGFYMDDWDYEKFHIFRGEVTLSQGF